MPAHPGNDHEEVPMCMRRGSAAAAANAASSGGAGSTVFAPAAESTDAGSSALAPPNRSNWGRLVTIRRNWDRLDACASVGAGSGVRRVRRAPRLEMGEAVHARNCDTVLVDHNAAD